MDLDLDDEQQVFDVPDTATTPLAIREFILTRVPPDRSWVGVFNGRRCLLISYSEVIVDRFIFNEAIIDMFFQKSNIWQTVEVGDVDGCSTSEFGSPTRVFLPDVETLNAWIEYWNDKVGSS